MVRFKQLLWLLLTGLSALSIKALTIETPYDAIAGRNLFGLHPAVVVEAPTPKPPPLPKITLTGITTILGRRVAFITINGVKAGDAPQSLMVVEGQVVNGIEVKSIDEQAGIVKVINSGEGQILDFDQAKSSDGQPIKISMGFQPIASPVQVREEIPMSPEDQAALIEVQRIKFQQDNNPVSALLPPTELTPEIQNNDSGTPR